MDSTALYYPAIEPPIAWLRAAALFFDKVTSFVPRESDDAITDQLKEFRDRTGAWGAHRPDEDTAVLVDVSASALDATCARIASDAPGDANNVKVKITFDGPTVSVAEHVFMHGSKLAPL